MLLSGLLKLIADDDNALKTLAYSATGKLGSRVPHLVNKDLALLQTFFEALLQVRCSETSASQNIRNQFTWVVVRLTLCLRKHFWL